MITPPLKLTTFKVMSSIIELLVHWVLSPAKALGDVRKSIQS